MIYYIKGKVTYKLEQSVVIENSSGMGFEVHVPAGSRLYLADQEEEVTCYTEMTVREGDMSLYGFDDRTGLELFKTLVTVNGVGAKAALAILSAMSAAELKHSILCGDAVMLTRANGVGKKTAQRIVLELKDKLGHLERDEAGNGGTSEPADEKHDGTASARAEAVDALVALGYSAAEAHAALSGVTGGAYDTEGYIREALKRI